LFLCLSRIFKSFVAMDCFYKSCIEMDLVMLHYVSFIQPFGVLWTEAISFDAEQFKNNYINKFFESKNSDPFLLLEEHFFATIVEYKKIWSWIWRPIARSCSVFFINIILVVYFEDHGIEDNNTHASNLKKVQSLQATWVI
jgi:hypothetical protein